MKTLGAAVIGCGVIGPAHAASFSAVPGVELRVVCDVQPQRAQRLALEMNTTPLIDARQVWDDPAIDVVSLAVEHPAHAELFVQAVAAGKAVICEKPLASTWADIERIVAAVRQAKKPTSGVFQHRYSPIVRQLKTMLDDGDLGAITGGKVWFRCRRGPEYFQTDAWRGKAVGEGGGVFINQAIHFIDLLTHFLGEPQAVRGRVEHRWVPNIEVEDAGTAQVVYPNGITGELDIANVPNKCWDARITVTTRRGGFTLNADHRVTDRRGFSQAALAVLDQAGLAEEMLPPLPGKKEYGPWHLLQFADFIRACRAAEGGSGGGETADAAPPLVGIPQAAATNRLILGVYASAQQAGKEIDLTQPWTGPYQYVPMPVAAG